MKKLPHNPTVRHHSWSDDPERDRRVRLAEDGRTEPGSTLEEAIADVWQSKHSAYRMISEGELIEDGDEWFCPEGRGWMKTSRYWSGQPFSSVSFKPLRRRVTNTGGER